MTYEKPNPAIDEKLETEIVNLRGAIHRTQDIADLKDHPGWAAINADLRDRLEQIEGELDRFESLTPEGRVIILKERKDLRLLTTLVDAAIEKVPEMYETLKQAEHKFNERKTRNGTIHT